MRNILMNGKAYELQTWYMEHESPHHRQVSWPPRSKVKVARSRVVSDSCWSISRVENVLHVETPKLVGRLPIPRAIRCTSFKVKGQRSRSPGRLMLRPEVRHIFRMETPMNFKLGTQMELEDFIDKRHGLQGQRSRLQGHVMWLIGVGR